MPSQHSMKPFPSSEDDGRLAALGLRMARSLTHGTTVGRR